MGSLHDRINSASTYTKSISITSGKGGVGKSTILVNLAFEFQRMEKTTLILDGDLGMGNVDIMFNVRPKHTILDVIQGRVTLYEILHRISSHIYLIPGGSGLGELQNLSNFERLLLLDQINQLDLQFDYLLVDTSPGIDNNVLYLNSAVQEIVVVTTPEPASLTDAYALIKVLNQQHKISRFSVVCNKVSKESEGLSIYKKLSDVAAHFLFVSLDYKGSIPLDPNLTLATKEQRLVSQAYMQSPSSRSIQNLAKGLAGISCEPLPKGGLQFFLQQLVSAV